MLCQLSYWPKSSNHLAIGYLVIGYRDSAIGLSIGDRASGDGQASCQQTASADSQIAQSP
jgi:hypothetical protein